MDDASAGSGDKDPGFVEEFKDFNVFGGTGGGLEKPGTTYGHDIDAHGGWVASPGSGGGGAPASGDKAAKAAAHVSHLMSGFLDVGSGSDKHNIGTDADGNPINAAHLSLNAYFRLDDAVDGPLKFDGAYEISQQGSIKMESHFEWDKAGSHGFKCGVRNGMYRWHSYCVAYCPTDGGEGGIPDPKKPPPPSNGIPEGYYGQPGGKEGGAGKWPIYSPWKSEDGPWAYSAAPMEFAAPVFMGRPQFSSPGATDTRNWFSPDSTVLRRMDVSTPIVARIEAFGKQLGLDWVYCEKPLAAKYRGGTAAGGFFVTPAGLGLEDAPTSFAPPGRTVCPAYFAVLADSFFGAGVPDFTTGGIKTGYRWGADATGVLGFDKVSSAAAITRLLTMDQTSTPRLGVLTNTPQAVFHVASASVRVDLTTGNVAAGAPAIPGLIGTGPTVNTQNAWGQINIGGTNFWFPLWV